MKKIKLLSIFSFLFIFISCNDDQNTAFDGGQTLVQFAGSSSIQPVVIEGTASTDIVVEVSSVSSSDRAIEVVIGENSTATANQYSISNLVIPAGEYQGTIKVTGNYDNIPQGSNFLLELKLLGLPEEGESIGKDTFKITFFRFCPVQIGTYTIDMHDSYGDGWQTNGGNGGNGITATLVDADGNETVLEFGMCTPYEPSPYNCSGTPATTGFTDASTTIEVPEGTKDIIWSFPGDAYGEISFEIYAPNGNQLFESGAPGALGAGVLPPFVYCL